MRVKGEFIDDQEQEVVIVLERNRRGIKVHLENVVGRQEMSFTDKEFEAMWQLFHFMNPGYTRPDSE